MELEESNLPSYYEFVSKAWDSFRSTMDKPDLKARNQSTQSDVILVIIFSLGWTVLREFLTNGYFLPFARNVKMSQSNIDKFPESAWKLFWYSCSWAFSCYTLFFCGYDYFQRPLHIWEGWTSDSEVPKEVYMAYLFQMSFYVHSVYGTLYIDQWRKDSIVMLIHHFLTMTLIGFSYAVRYHKIGMLVLFLHDVSDICLEFSKCSVYMKTRNNKFDVLADCLSTIGFVSFASTWFVFRLYWFPLKVLYSASYGVTLFQEQSIPFFFIFNILLWVLLSLHIYWFMFIVNLSIKIVMGNVKIDDNREFDSEDETKNS